jgi:hypothetical protein
MNPKHDFTESGRKGGLARAKKLSKRARSESARLASVVRWTRYKTKKLLAKPTD